METARLVRPLGPVLLNLPLAVQIARGMVIGVLCMFGARRFGVLHHRSLGLQDAPSAVHP